MIAVVDFAVRGGQSEVGPAVRLALLCVVCTAVLRPCRADEPPENVRIGLNEGATRIEVTGLAPRQIQHIQAYLSGEGPDAAAAAWPELLAVRVAGLPDDAPTVLGALAVEGETIVFTPRFPLRAGLTYRVSFNPGGIRPLADGAPGAARPVTADVTVPAERPSPPTTITAVYPSGGELPENLLKFYIHFSAPMGRGQAYQHIRILDANGHDVPDAFLQLGEELWDADARRLTLLFDPGRIKRGLKPNEDIGAPLAAGKKYSLSIDAGWRDSRQTPLASGFIREFQVTPFDDVQPDPHEWRLSRPAAGSREPLVVAFNEPLDHALLQHALVVRSPQGDEVEGEIAVDQGEARWQFTPREPWVAGQHALVVDPILEDRAGNSVARPFETESQQVVGQGASAAPVALPFSPVGR